MFLGLCGTPLYVGFSCPVFLKKNWSSTCFRSLSKKTYVKAFPFEKRFGLFEMVRIEETGRNKRE
jgi:hypothetical protein